MNLAEFFAKSQTPRLSGGSYWLKPSGGETGNHSPFVQGITESAKKDAIKKMEEAFKKK